ncbi:MAG: PTS glucose transporter subunit IIBC [Lachnospiraceae bacterium]|jgi:PTS system N-acetylglucosamine-specific IIC component|nr:PTS glucose transporter subunit IIBC [Lachnospiraceae bacterium]
MMKYLQRIGKALMLPVACLPVCGILMGLGYALNPATMQGGDTVGAAATIGLFLVKAGGALIDNMSWLFVIGVAIGMSDDNDGTAALAGIVSWLMITNLLSSGTVSALTGADADPAFGKIGNQFIGILSGLIGASCYNRFKGTKLPDALAFFSGKRCVAIVTGIVSIIVSAVLFFVWPFIYGLLVSVGSAIVSLGAAGAGIYAFLNRLLIPFGLHHALNSVFWFDAIGIADLSKFWGFADGAVVGETGQYMAGFFAPMMFGIPAAALAIVHCAKPEQRKIAAGIMGSAAICSFICGVTEPFEFAFLFLAPALYLVYAILYGVFTFVAVSLGFRAGFCFSAGLTDLIFSSQLPTAQKVWLIIPLGIAAAIVFYILFRVVITKFDLKTPGREDADEYANEVNAVLANDDFTKVAEIVLEGIGGKENITSFENCITRLRFEIKDYTLVDEKKIKSAGVSGVIRPSKTAVQVVVGVQVQHVADELKKMM